VSRGVRVPVMLSWSGGKDSALTLHALRESEGWRVAGLLTTVSAAYDRVAMHGVRRTLLEAQAAALQLPLTIVELPVAPSDEQYEEIMGAAMAGVRAMGISRVAFGDLFLEEVRHYREEALTRVGMRALFPLWGMPTPTLARRFIDLGFRAILTCVDTEQLDGSFAGRSFDPSLLAELPPAADPCGEYGEFHTFVHAGPGFAREVPIRIGRKVLRDGRFMYRDLLPTA
jgi:uncharacterized protein (TIGR00290 family)